MTSSEQQGPPTTDETTSWSQPDGESVDPAVPAPGLPVEPESRIDLEVSAEEASVADALWSGETPADAPIEPPVDAPERPSQRSAKKNSAAKKAPAKKASAKKSTA